LADGRFATAAIRLPERWIDTVRRQGHGYDEMVAVYDGDAAREHLLMNLRLSEGVDLAAYELRWGTRPDAARIAALAQQGFLNLDGEVLAATPAGRLLLNRVIAELLN
jgi:oxygen-independent coproporphyrinogen-3 oxidase